MKIARRQFGLFILLFAVSSLLVHSPPGAFAANGDITNVRSMTGPTYPFEHDLSQGKHNSLVQVDSDTYALAYSGVDDDGFISTFTISSDGATITEVDSLEHDTDTNSHPIQKNGANSLVKVDSDTFALAYTGADEDGFISTFTIDSDGNITAVRTQSEGNNFEYDTSKGWNNSLVKVDSDTVALAYTDVWGDGIIKTFTISSDGTTITQVESLEHDTSSNADNSLVHVDSDIFALAYNGAGQDGFISTFSIDSDGDITAIKTQSEGNNFEYDDRYGYHNSLVKVDSDTVLLAYMYSWEGSPYGKLSSFTIDSDGNITEVINSSTFEIRSIKYISVLQVDSDTYAVAWTNYQGFGKLTTMTINPDGTYPSQSRPLLIFDNYNSFNSLVKVDSDTIALASAGAGDDGLISTFGIGGDTTAPTVTITSSTGSSGDTVSDTTLSFTATFSEFTSNFVVGDITVTGTANGSSPAASNFAGSGTTYTFDVVKGSSDGTVSVSVAAGKATDVTGNDNTVSNTYTFTIDSTSPTVAITSSTGSSGSSTSSTTLSYTATFSESTSNFVVGDITVTGTANDSSPAASNFAGSGTTYTFDVVKGSSDGTVSVSVAADKATDASGNDNTVSNTYALTIDSTSPTVTITSSTGDSGDTVSDTTLSYTATFSESTSNFVVGDITVTGTANDSSPAASNFAGSGTTYTFDVVKGSSDGTVSVSVAAGRATDAAGNDNTVSNTYALTIDTTVTSSGASTQGTSCFASPRCAIISVPDGFSINEKSYTLFKNTHTLPTYEAIVGQPVTITLKIPVTSELLQIMSTTIYVEIFNSFEDYEDAARIKYSLTDETIQYTNQSIFEVVGAKNESKLIKLSKDYPENVPESQIPAINFVEITFTMIFAKPMDTSHVVIETEGNYNMHEIIYLRDALVVKENSLNALTLDEVSKFKPELVYDPLPFVDPLKEPSHYIKRYLSEPEYKEWFDTNYPSYTIYEGIGISKYEFDEIVKQLTSPEPLLNNYQGSVIPEWVKNNAAWWSEGVIYDNDFVSGIEFLIKEGIIMVSVTESGEKSDAVIPEWVKNNAAWWSEDIISEKEFLSGIEYLVNNGIIQVN